MNPLAIQNYLNMLCLLSILNKPGLNYEKKGYRIAPQQSSYLSCRWCTLRLNKMLYNIFVTLWESNADWLISMFRWRRPLKRAKRPVIDGFIHFEARVGTCLREENKSRAEAYFIQSDIRQSYGHYGITLWYSNLVNWTYLSILGRWRTRSSLARIAELCILSFCSFQQNWVWKPQKPRWARNVKPWWETYFHLFTSQCQLYCTLHMASSSL